METSYIVWCKKNLARKKKHVKENKLLSCALHQKLLPPSAFYLKAIWAIVLHSGAYPWQSSVHIHRMPGVFVSRTLLQAPAMQRSGTRQPCSKQNRGVGAHAWFTANLTGEKNFLLVSLVGIPELARQTQFVYNIIMCLVHASNLACVLPQPCTPGGSACTILC